MRLSLIIGFLMLVIKVGAYWLTGSAAVLGDASESVVHIVAVIFATYSLWLSEQPADENHTYGHSKISFFSAGVEGGLIILAAIYIAYESIHRWVTGAVIANLDMGLGLTALSILINGALGFYLIRTGKQQSSLILIANGKHVLTDSWTSLGAVLGLSLTYTTSQQWWDPLCGLIMAGNILFSGYGLIRQSILGLMDEADPVLARELEEALSRETQARGIIYHALRHRNAGVIHYADVHLLFPDHILLKDAHRLATEIEDAVEDSLDRRVQITSHLECRGDHDKVHDRHP
jgi:cation diffusion facilitator family transporter